MYRVSKAAATLSERGEQEISVIPDAAKIA